MYNSENIADIDDIALDLVMSDTFCLDSMLCQLRGVIIAFSKVDKENIQLEIEPLKNKLDNLTERPLLTER